MDPSVDSFDPPVWEFYRCCLLRTLLSYNGQSTQQGGATLRPDLAASLPTVSPDGLTWTFRLKSGIHYAPPYQRTEITASDFIRAMQRELAPSPSYLKFGPFLGNGADLYFEDVIQGAHEYSEGKAPTVTGLEAPDRYTFRVHLSHPTGDLGYRLTFPGTAPIPPGRLDPAAPFGAATGHEGDYGDFLVASGPYMYAGSEGMDFANPVVDQEPPSGIRADSITLVRNPSWDARTDSLRKAFVDRIVLERADEGSVVGKIGSGGLDLVMDFTLPPDVVDRYRSAPELRRRLFVSPNDSVLFLYLNVATPPLDDLHVRRAVNFAVDKQAVLQAFETHRDQTAAVATHFLPDSEEGSLPLDFNPYRPGLDGNIEAAQREMATVTLRPGP